MRFKVFVSLLVITLVLDIALLSFSLLRPAARVFELPVALAAAPPAAQLLAAKSVAFTPADKAVRANIRLALDHYYGALTHVVLPPEGVFSFNATLGLVPQHLPWKNVKLKPTAVPAPAPDGPPA